MNTAETGYVGFAIQAEQGTFVEPTDFMRVLSVDMNPEADKLIPDTEIGAGRDVTDVKQGAYRVAGSIESYLRPEAAGVLFRAALGGYTASGSVATGAYLHNFSPIDSGDLPWVSIKKGVSDEVKIFNYTDCKVDGFNVDMAANEMATVNFDIVGTKDTVGATDTPAYETAPILVGSKGKITVGGAVFSVKTAKIEYKNNLINDDYRIGSRFMASIAEKRRDLKITLDVVLDATNKLYEKAFYGSSNATEAGFDVFADSVDIEIESPTNIGSSDLPYKYLFNFKNVVFETASIPTSGDDLIVIPLELKPIKVGSDNVMDIKLWNSKDTYL